MDVHCSELPPFPRELKSVSFVASAFEVVTGQLQVLAPRFAEQLKKGLREPANHFEILACSQAFRDSGPPGTDAGLNLWTYPGISSSSVFMETVSSAAEPAATTTALRNASEQPKRS